MNLIKLNKVHLYVFTLLYFTFFIFFKDFYRYNTQSKELIFTISDTSIINCISRVSDGLLYNSAEISCHNGPFYYYTLYFLKSLPFQDFFFIVFLFSLILSILSLVILYKIIEKEVGGYYFLAFILALLLGIEGDYSVLWALFWFFIGFYLLFYTNICYKEAISGLLFAISFLTKQTYIIPITLTILFYSIKILEVDIKKLKLIKIHKSYKIFQLIIPFIAVIFISQLLFPYFLIYTFSFIYFTFFIGTPNFLGTPHTFLELGKALNESIFNLFRISNPLLIIFLISAIILSLYLILKKRDFIGYFTFFSVLASFFHFFFGDNSLEYKRIIFIVPFFIIVFVKLVKLSKGNKVGRLLLIFVFLFISYPALKIAYLTYSMNNLNEEVGYIWHYFPQQQGQILADKDRLQFYDYKNKYTITTIQREFFEDYDPVIIRISKKLGLIDINRFEKEELKKKGTIYSQAAYNISQRKYSAIISLLQERGNVQEIIALMGRAAVEKNTSFNQLFPMECYVYIPTIEEGCADCAHKVRTYFLDKAHCEQMKDAMVKYYKEHSSSICKKDEQAWNFVSATFAYNSIDFNEECESGGNLLQLYSNRNKFTKNDLIILLSIFLFVLLFYFLKKENRKVFHGHLKEGYRDNKKFLLVFILLILLIATLYGISKVFIVCGGNYIKSGGECCLDDNKDFICDEEPRDELKECIVFVNSQEGTISRTCNSTEECILKAKEMGFPDSYLNQDTVECRDTQLYTLDQLITCTTDKDCFETVDKLYPDILLHEEAIKCGKHNFCQTTEYLFIGLKKVRK